jgi:hypothetical protein
MKHPEIIGVRRTASQSSRRSTVSSLAAPISQYYCIAADFGGDWFGLRVKKTAAAGNFGPADFRIDIMGK